MVFYLIYSNRSITSIQRIDKKETSKCIRPNQSHWNVSGLELGRTKDHLGPIWA